MSYNLVNPTTGALTRVAGRGKAEYGASATRSGTYVPSSSVQTQEDLSFSVTFDTPMPDTDYQVIFGSASNSASSGTIQCVVRGRETTGFTGILRNVGTSPISVASGTFTWFAFKLYSDVEYSNIVNSMPSDASASNKLVTKSDLPKKYIDTGSGISFDTCRIALGLPYPCRFKFEFWAIDNSCLIEGYAYRESASVAPITRYVGTSGYVINSNAGGTMACYTGTDNVQGTFICTEVKG